MMELTCAFILISASLVLATPHGYGGYGVKGGASARAESSASAGAFGGVPVAVPLGAGYSGSFSKSSSSSSASLGGSSSSSSSALSYSGSGAGGFGLNGGAPGHGGCSSGNCETAGGHGIPAPHGSTAQGYNSANAAAAAGAEAVSGSGCQGLSCAGNSEKCTSGQCKPNLQTGTPSIDSESNKCTSGLCGSALENGASPTNYESNDIRAVTASSDSAHNANHQSSGIDKTSSAYNGEGSDCSHGKCGPSGSSSLKPNYYGHDSGNSYQGSSTSNNLQASSSDAGITSHYQKPSPHLESPKLGSKCKSGNCNAGPHEPGHETSPSSYNVPIHGTYDKSEPKPSCDGVKCENQPKGPYSPTDNSVKKGPSSFDYPSSTNCAGSSCFGKPGNQVTGGSSFTASQGSLNFGTPINTVTGGPSLTVKPGNVNFGNSPSHVPTLPTGSNLAPGHIGHNGKPSDVNNKLPNDKLPPYTGGFGGPAGILKPNEYTVHAPAANPSYGHASTPQNGKPLGSAPTGCNSPSCSGYPSASITTAKPVLTGTYSHRPSGDIPSEKLPPYTGGFGGPTGMLKPNEFDVHATVTNKPTYAQPGSPSYNTQSPVGNIGAPGCQAGGTCGGYSPTAGATSGASAPSSYYGTTKPNNGIHSPNDKQPSYTGGFGGPGGVFNPDKYDIHSTGPSSLGYTPSGTFNSPASSGPEGCKTPNCSPSLGSTAAANAQAESIGITKPSSGPHLSSVTLPAYPSGYDSPTEVHRPNEISGPASTPGFAHTQTPSSPSSYSPGCKTGNCADLPTSGASAGANAQPGSYGVTKPNTDVKPAAPANPQYTGGFGGPSGTFNPSEHNAPGCKTGNCVNYPTSGASAGANAQPGSYGVTKPNTANPEYTGGSSGPSGTVNPNHHNSPGCKTGNCGDHPTSGASAGANAQPGSYGVTKPNTDVNPAAPANPQYTGGFGGPSGTFNLNEHNSPGCKTGNCANYPTSGASAGANAQSGSYGVTKPNKDVNPATPANPQYTGGFGGPSGTVNPNQHNSPGCKTGNCADLPTSGASAGANAQPGSYGVTKPNTDVKPAAPANPQYTGGFGGPSGTFNPSEHNAPGCKTGNCVNYPTSGASAGANAQPGSYGVTKPNTANPEYTGGSSGPSGTVNPNQHNSPGCKTGNCGDHPTSGASAGANAQPGSYGVTKPNTDVNPAAPANPQYTGGFGGPSGTFNLNEHNSPGCKTGNCANYPTSGASAGANAQSGSYGVTKPNKDVNPAAPANPQYTGGFGGPSGTVNPNQHNPPGCKTGNCADHPTSGASAGANAQPGSYGVTKPNTDVKPAVPANPQYTGGFGGPSGTFNPSEHNSPGCKTGNCANYPTSGASAGANAQPGSYGFTKPNTANPQYTGGFGGPSGTVNPNQHNSPACKTGNCADHPTSGASAGANAQPGSYVVTKPNTDVNPATPTQPQYTGGFGGPSEIYKHNEHTYVTPSTGSAPINCKTPNCVGSPTVSADATTGANAQPGSYGITKPSAGNNPSNEKPIYTGGFGGATGLLKPNEYTVSAVSLSPNNKPTGASTPAACTSGNCNPQTPHGSAPHTQNGVSTGAHATAAATAEANAVAYTGGFGGPPGVLAPYDDGKIGALPYNGGQPHGSQIGGAHGSHNANIHSQHGTIPGANGGPTGPAGAHGITGAQTSSNAGTTASAGAAAGASAGAHGSNYNNAGNVKGGSPCSGGCGGSGGGAYNGGSTYEVSGGHGFPKLVFSDGLNGAGSTSGATAKSLSGANAFGLGGSYASSSASAHASAGAYTKGGYGKR